MTFYRDLTPYEYADAEPQPDVLNVGWLSREQSFPRTVPDGRFVDILRRLVANPTNLFRGWHVCELCPPQLAKDGKFDEITRRAADFVQVIKAARPAVK